MKTQCPHCKAKFNTSEKSIGKQTKCPKCSQPFVIQSLIENPIQHQVKSTENFREVDDSSFFSGAQTLQRPIPKKLSKYFYMGFWITLRCCALASFFYFNYLAGQRGELAKRLNYQIYFWLIVTGILVVCTLSVRYMLYYKMWAAIQDNYARITPTKAICFLFIPFFNVYWAALVLVSFAEDYNKFIERYSIKAKQLSNRLFWAHASFFLLFYMYILFSPVFLRGRFPDTALAFAVIVFIQIFFGIWFLFVYPVVYLLVANKICDSVNTLAELASVEGSMVGNSTR